MMFRSTLVLWGAVAIAAVPVWADRISVTDVVKESPGVDSLVNAAHHPDLGLSVLLFPAGSTQAVTLIDPFETNDASTEASSEIEIPAKAMRSSGLLAIASLNAESLPEFAPELVLNGGVHASDSFDFWGPWFPQPKTKFFRFLPQTSIHAAGVSETDSYKAGSFVSHVWESWRTEGRGSTGNNGKTNLTENTLAPAVHVVPEPGSLSLLLLGLAAIGFSGRRHGRPLTAV